MTPAEARSVTRIRPVYSEYLRAREYVLNEAGRPGSPPLATLDAQLDRGVNPLLSVLAAYADAHFREGREALATLRRDGNARKSLLALVLGFALLSLIATVWVARGIVLRLREYAEFAAQVAEGELGARLDSRRRDELGTLAASLNTMVEQLRDSARQRGESVAERHIELGVTGTEVVVLNRNNSKDRLEATNEVRQDDARYRVQHVVLSDGSSCRAKSTMLQDESAPLGWLVVVAPHPGAVV